MHTVTVSRGLYQCLWSYLFFALVPQEYRPSSLPIPSKSHVAWWAHRGQFPLDLNHISSITPSNQPDLENHWCHIARLNSSHFLHLRWTSFLYLACVPHVLIAVLTFFLSIFRLHVFLMNHGSLSVDSGDSTQDSLLPHPDAAGTFYIQN